MKNPGLSVHGMPTATFERPSTHPLWGDVNDDVDPDRRVEPEDEDESDWVPFTNWDDRLRNPGRSLRVPVRQGPTFAPHEAPEDVVHGVVMSPEEQDAADRIINGEHDSDNPSANPFVEDARQKLRTPGTDVAVSTLGRMLRGERPADVDLDQASQWYRQHFTHLRVNPLRGTMEASSPAGKQVAVRQPAVAETPTTYKLTNDHGTFESEDPDRLVRSALAFQIVRNEMLVHQREEKDKDDQDDQQAGLNTTSGIMHDWFSQRADIQPSGLGTGVRDWFRGKMRDKMPGMVQPDVPAAGVSRFSHPNFYPNQQPQLPARHVFEPGRGMDVGPQGPKGPRGGYVARLQPGESAPPGWLQDKQSGLYHSPGHYTQLRLDPTEAVIPRADKRYPGHYFTYAPSGDYQDHRIRGGNHIFVSDMHPTYGTDMDQPPKPEPAPEPRPGPGTVQSPRRTRAPRPPRAVESAEKSNMNDLCPVCASGYLEPYDSTYHECLNCGSLVKHVGFEKAAAAKRPGGLGRGLKDIQEYTQDPLGLAEGGSENPDATVDLDETQAHHPLAGEVADPEAETYQAPAKGSLMRRRQAAEADPIDEFMGKQGFMPLHRAGEERTYLAQMPGTSGGYIRLTEGAPHPKTGDRGWVLSADHVPTRERWLHTEGPREGMPSPRKYVNLDVLNPETPRTKPVSVELPDLTNRQMGEWTKLAEGVHPIEDDHLNRAIRDVALRGRSSKTYTDAALNTAFEPKQQPAPPVEGSPYSMREQRRLRGLSTTNPGLARFESAS